jgi:hypothetical protein
MTGNSIGDQIGKFEARSTDLQDQSLPDFTLRQISAGSFGEIGSRQVAALNTALSPLPAKSKSIFFSLLFASFWQDLFDLMIVFRLIQSIAITPPQEYASGVLPAMIGLPAIVGSFLGVMLTKDRGARSVLSTLCIYRASLIFALLILGNLFSLPGFILPIFLSALSALIGVSLVARITLLMTIRKAQLIPNLSFPLLMGAVYLAACFAFENFSSLNIYRWGIFFWLLSAYLYTDPFSPQRRSASSLIDDGEPQNDALLRSVNERAASEESIFKKLAPHLFCLLFIKYGAFIFWGCLCLFGCENFQGDSHFFLNSLSSALCGVTSGFIVRLLFSKWTTVNSKGLIATNVSAQFGKLIFLGIAPLGFAFLGQAPLTMQFIFAYSFLWTFFMCSGFSRRRRNSRQAIPNLRYEKLAGWSQALIFATIVVLAILLEPRLASVSSTAQIRMLALASGAIYIGSWATLVLLRLSRARERRHGTP